MVSKGEHRSKEIRRKISLTLKGRKILWAEKISRANKGKHNSPKTEFTPERLKMLYKKNKFFGMKGKHHSEETKRKMSLAHKGYIPVKAIKKSIELRQNKEYKEKIIKKILRSLLERPTKLEQEFINFFKRHNLPFTYCGDGSLIIGGRNPDFYENNGKKICLEVGNKREKGLHSKGNWNSWQEYQKKRINHFKKFGWKCIVLWENELNDKNSILEKIIRR